MKLRDRRMHHRSGEREAFSNFPKAWKIVFVPPASRRSGSIFLGPFHQIRDIAYGYAQRHANVCADGRTCSVICMCLSTNIEIFSFIFNITGANATRTIQIREMRRFHSRLILPGDSMRRGVESKDEARDEFTAHGSANTGFHQDRIQIGNMFTLKTF